MINRLAVILGLIFAMQPGIAQTQTATVVNETQNTIYYSWAEADPSTSWDSHYRTYGWIQLSANSSHQLSTEGGYIWVYAVSEDQQYEWKYPYSTYNSDVEICVRDNIEQYVYAWNYQNGEAQATCRSDTGHHLVQAWYTAFMSADESTFRLNNDNRSWVQDPQSVPNSNQTPTETEKQKQHRKAEEQKTIRDNLLDEVKLEKERYEDKCEPEVAKINALKAIDLLLVDPDYLRSMIECHDSFEELENLITEIRSVMEHFVSDAMTDLQRVESAVDDALTQAQLVANVEAFRSQNLTPLMPPQARDSGEVNYFTELGNAYINDQFNGIIATSDYEAFLLASKAFCRTFISLGSALNTDPQATSLRKFDFLDAVKSVLSLLEEKAISSPGNPVPESVWATLENDLVPQNADPAANLEMALKQWTGATATPYQKMVLDTILMVGGGYARAREIGATLEPHINDRMKGLVEDLARISYDLIELPNFQAVDSVQLACEMAAGKKSCDPGDRDLTVSSRLIAATDLTGNQVGVTAEVAPYYREFPNFMTSPDEILNLMKRMVIK